MSPPTHTTDPMHIMVNSIKGQLDGLLVVAGHEHHEQPKVPKVLTAEQKAKNKEKKQKREQRKTQYAADLTRRTAELTPDKVEHYKTEHAKLVKHMQDTNDTINKVKGESNEQKAAHRETVMNTFKAAEKKLHDELGITSSMMGLPDNLWNPNTYMRAGDSLKYL